MSTAKFDTLSTLDGSYSVPVSRVAQGSAAAWVNFNGTGTVAIRASFNVSSITDNGTGSYTLNFTTALPNTNYCCLVGGGSDLIATSDQKFPIFFSETPLTTTIRIGIRQVDNNDNTFVAADSSDVNVSIFD